MKICLFASPIVAAFFVLNCWGQNAPASAPPPNSFLDRLTSLTDSDWRPWTAEQFATVGHIRDAAMTDPNAYNMLAHLTDNIGPRLSGSLQAQAAVEWVAAKMREMGTSVTLGKTTVPHWVRGKEDAVLTRWPGMPHHSAANTLDKVNVQQLNENAAVMAVTAYALADASEAIPRRK
jgi:carboxypeptidase Q